LRVGEAFWALERRKEACDAFTEALNLDPENKDVIVAYNIHQKEYIGTHLRRKEERAMTLPVRPEIQRKRGMRRRRRPL
jgi:hypothetical protein